MVVHCSLGLGVLVGFVVAYGLLIARRGRSGVGIGWSSAAEAEVDQDACLRVWSGWVQRGSAAASWGSDD